MAWAILRHSDVFRVLRDHETFSSARSPLVERGLSQRITLLHDDPPRHSVLRRLVNQAFTTKRVEALEPWIRELASELLDVVGDGETEIMHALAIPLPMMVIARLLGFPREEFANFRRWSEAFVAISGMPHEERQRNLREMAATFGGLALARRKQGAADLITALVEAKADGECLTEQEILGFCILLLVAGNETTTNLIGNLLNILAERPAIWEQLRQDRSLVDAAIEETVRFESPLQRLTRSATRDVELSGRRIAAGDYLVVFFGAANRDPEAFQNPDEFRLDRNLDGHMGFGTGIHYCMGAPLARAETRIVLNALLDRFAVLKPSETGSVRQAGGFTVLGFEKLPIFLARSKPACEATASNP
jgi:cytochrome P450